MEWIVEGHGRRDEAEKGPQRRQWQQRADGGGPKRIDNLPRRRRDGIGGGLLKLRLFGGQGEGTKNSRDLTDIEQSVMEVMIKAALATGARVLASGRNCGRTETSNRLFCRPFLAPSAATRLSGPISPRIAPVFLNSPPSRAPYFRMSNSLAGMSGGTG